MDAFSNVIASATPSPASGTAAATTARRRAAAVVRCARRITARSLLTAAPPTGVAAPIAYARFADGSHAASPPPSPRPQRPRPQQQAAARDASKESPFLLLHTELWQRWLRGRNEFYALISAWNHMLMMPAR